MCLHPYWRATIWFISNGILQQNKSNRKCIPKLSNFNKNIQKHIVEVLSSSFDVLKLEENLIIRYCPFYSVLIHQLTNTNVTLKLFSFCKVNKTCNSTAFLSIQSNAWNMYWELEANLSLQHFRLACTCFEGVIGLSLSSLKIFIPAEYSLGNARASQLGSEVKKKQEFDLLHVLC